MATKQILIVDDSAAVRKNFSDILTRAGYAVSEAYNGYDALEKLKKGQFDLLLLDLELPQLSGFEVLRIVKSGGPIKDLPVLCVTGIHKDLEDIHKLKEIGALGFVDKNVPQETLLFRIQRALG
jgi:CheY-like chemotaxis protein